MSHYFSTHLQLYKSSTACAKKLFKPSKDAASSDVVQTVTFATETWLNFRDETETSSKTPRPRLEAWMSRLRSRLQNLWILPKCFSKMSSSLLTSIFFKFLAFFQRVLVVSYLQIGLQQTKNRWVIEILINHFFAIFIVSRPEIFKSETKSRDSITGSRSSGLH